VPDLRCSIALLPTVNVATARLKHLQIVSNSDALDRNQWRSERNGPLSQAEWFERWLVT
jgi:hypothetical protein